MEWKRQWGGRGHFYNRSLKTEQNRTIAGTAKLRQLIRHYVSVIRFQEPRCKLRCLQLPLVQPLDEGQETSADGHHAVSDPCTAHSREILHRVPPDIR